MAVGWVTAELTTLLVIDTRLLCRCLPNYYTTLYKRLLYYSETYLNQTYPIVQTENAKSTILSRTKSTVRGPSRWFNVDHDRGQILSFSSPSRNHVDRGSMSKCTLLTYVYKVSRSYKVCLKNKCKCGHFYCMWDLIRNYAYLWSDKVIKKGHILSLISSAVLSYLIIPRGDYPRLSINTKQ